MISVRVYGILITPNQEILVSDEFIRGNYFTKFPGGGLEQGEGTRDCLIREFQEELNLAIEVGPHLYTTDFYQQSAFNASHQILSIYYLVRATAPFNTAFKQYRFQFEPHQISDRNACAEVFRLIPIDKLTTEDVDLPIDKLVVQQLIQKGVPGWETI